MKDKKQKIDYFSDNLAFPEVHVNSQVNTTDDQEETQEGNGDVVFDNLAVPEVKIRKQDKKR